MKIIGNTIHFKSIPSFYIKEKLGIKSNTVREIEQWRFKNYKEYNIKYIAIHCDNEYFVRTLKDISFYQARYIFSW